MGGAVVVATFATLSPGTVDATIKLRIRDARITVATLTIEHPVGEGNQIQALGVDGAMDAAVEIAAIEGMGRTRAV